MRVKLLLAGLLLAIVIYERTNILKVISSAGLRMIARLEGFSATPYNDPPGSSKWSIGYGHQIQPGEIFTAIDEATARDLLAKDTAHAQDVVRLAITAPLDAAQFDALTSFVYNVGAGAFKSGSVPGLINAGRFAAAAAKMKEYVNAGGRISVALIARRELEAAAFA
jgi:lysozyme